MGHEQKAKGLGRGSSIPVGFGFELPGDEWITRVRNAESPVAPGRIGTFEVAEEVSRGGQGVVYRARQAGTNREVALKRLVSGSLATPATRARFEREIEAVSTLNHPNIVTAYFSELVDDQPLLAMEWIDGVPLDAWARGKEAGARPSVCETLRVFERICGAVQHAHQRGVIHRDLKPSNVLVDAAGDPHVLDFGLAKTAANDSSAAAQLTHSTSFLGTPAYTSPEQARGDHDAVDIRSDVYALGVMLYEALSGTLPYETDGSPVQVLRAIEQTEPRRPSMIRSALDRELDAIVLKALEKDRQRRYQSVDALGGEIRRYLDGDPVLAHPPSLYYQARKLIARHRVGFVFAATTVLLVLTMGVGAMFFAARLAKERDEAVSARAEEVEARQAAQRITRFLQDMLASAAPQRATKHETTVRETLDVAAQDAEFELTAQPEILAAVRLTIGNTYRSLSLFKEAEPHLRFALETRQALLGEAHPDTIEAIARYGALQHDSGDLAQAESLAKRALILARSLDPPQELVVASAAEDLGLTLKDAGRYREAEALLREALEICECARGALDPQVAGTMTSLAQLLAYAGQLEEAESLYEDALMLQRQHFGDDHVRVADVLGSFAALLIDSHAPDRAEPLIREALTIYQGAYGERHVKSVTALNNLAGVLSSEGRNDEALALLERVLRIRREMLGDDHPDVAVSFNNLAGLLRATGDLEAAEDYYEQAVAAAQSALGKCHPLVATARSNLGYVLMLRGDLEGAERNLRESIAIRAELLGREHPQYAISLNNLAGLVEKRGHLDEAERLYAESTRILSAAYGERHPLVATGFANSGKLLLKRDRFAEAEASLRKSLEIRRATLPEGHPDTARTASELADALISQGKIHESESLLSEAYDALGEFSRGANDATIRAIERLVDLFESQDRDAEAAAWRVKLKGWNATTQPETDDAGLSGY